ncbi:pyridoxal phosphate-dependent decarboxylase family protein [Rhodohalobacter sp. 8-1]|uniref:pyridoxal phosphate-dependent decarboxylase family protein n=1 Tax=Rhodohalobacter sp. 8-1 TaxID=3131972 RepID=UPI0030EE2A66
MNRYEAYLPILQSSLRELDDWRTQYGEEQLVGFTDTPQIIDIIQDLRERLEGNYPFHHPQYAGQMLKPPHPIAWIAYTMTMTVNPNNHALDGGPPTSEMEKEAVARLAEMVGYENPYLGHLTSGGTIANLEALFVAREIHPQKAIAASSKAHYTHRRMCRVLNTEFMEIPDTHDGGTDWNYLMENLDKVGTVVVTMGTTGLGDVEPLADLLPELNKHGVRVHVDAAYGGFFKIIGSQLPSSNHWASLNEADSIVIDPHKHGLQPYGCGSIMFKDPSVGSFFKHDSPYTYFTSDDLHLGEISLECSRAGASAAAFWATLQLFPLSEDGLGEYMTSTVTAAKLFYRLLERSDKFECFKEPELDILAYFPIPKDETLSSISKLSTALFQAGAEAAPKEGLHLSLYKLKAKEFNARFPEYKADDETVTLLRSVLMKPEHEPFVTKLAGRLHTLLDKL